MRTADYAEYFAQYLGRHCRRCRIEQRSHHGLPSVNRDEGGRGIYESGPKSALSDALQSTMENAGERKMKEKTNDRIANTASRKRKKWHWLSCKPAMTTPKVAVDSSPVGVGEVWNTIMFTKNVGQQFRVKSPNVVTEVTLLYDIDTRRRCMSFDGDPARALR